MILDLLLDLIKILPRKIISRWVGRLAFWEGPRFWTDLSISSFVNKYNVNTYECEKPLNQYRSVGDFFIRNLKEGSRPISDHNYVHPCDSQLIHFGEIKNNHLEQIKGRKYVINDFLNDPLASQKWMGGYFFNYYLSPRDYHHFHAPITGKVSKITHIPGDLWPVNQWGLREIHSLFVQNERLILEIESLQGEKILMVLIGALNVGSIRLFLEPTIATNNPHVDVLAEDYHLKTPKEIIKGEDMGYFEFGSSIVMIYPQSFTTQYAEALTKTRPRPVRVNSAVI